MSATFSKEIVGLSVVDSRGDLLGIVADMMIELTTGQVGTLVVDLATSIDASLLPWPCEAGLMLLPSDEIDHVGTQVVLKR